MARPLRACWTLRRVRHDDSERMFTALFSQGSTARLQIQGPAQHRDAMLQVREGALKITGLMFHHFHDLKENVLPVQGSLSGDDLKRILDRWKSRLVSPRAVQAGHATPDDAVLTFDDGLISQWLVARPILDAYGLKAFWFVPTAPLVGVISRYDFYRWVRTRQFDSVDAFYDHLEAVIGRMVQPPRGFLAAHTYLTERDREFRYWRDEIAGPVEFERVMDAIVTALWHDGRSIPAETGAFYMARYQIRLLHSEGHVIGNHSHSHPMVFSRLTPEQQEVEYLTPTWIIQEITGVRPTTVSHPCNQVTSHGLDVLKRAGYTLGFAATPELREPHPLLCPRIDSADLRKA